MIAECCTVIVMECCTVIAECCTVIAECMLSIIKELATIEQVQLLGL